MANLRDLQKLLDKAAAEIPDKVLRIIAVEGQNFINKNFRDQGFNDVGVEKWEPRKTTDDQGRDLTKYRTGRRGKRGSLNQFGRRNSGRAILVGYNTGGDKLKNSFQSHINRSTKTVTFRSYKKYAARHNEGLDDMPKRQFIGKSAFLNKQIFNKVSKELDKQFKK